MIVRPFNPLCRPVERDPVQVYQAWEMEEMVRSAGEVVYLLDYADGTFTRSSEASLYGNFSFADGADDLSVSDMTWSGTNVLRKYADGSVLIEGARTNLLPDSEDLSAWAASSGSLTGGETSPDGTADAYRIETGAGLLGVFEAGASKTSGDPVSFSLFNRLGTSEICRHGVARLGAGVQINEAAAADWTRRSVSGTYGNTGAQNVLIAEGRAGQPITGNAASGATDQDVWGFMWEDAAFPSSYIRTSGAASTRAFDDLSGLSLPTQMQTGRWAFDVWPLFDHTEHGGYCYLWHNSSSEYLAFTGSNQFRYEAPGVDYTSASTLQWDRYQKLTFTIDQAAGDVILSGFTVGDGTYATGGTNNVWPATMRIGHVAGVNNFRISRPREA